MEFKVGDKVKVLKIDNEYFNEVVVDDVVTIITAMSAILGIYSQIKGLKKSPSDKPNKEQEMGANPPTEEDGKDALIQQIANNPDLNDEEKALLVASIETAGVMAVADMMIDKSQQNKETKSTNQYLLYGGIGFGVLLLTGVAIYVIKKRGKNNGK
jgi:hypothetical protein